MCSPPKYQFDQIATHLAVSSLRSKPSCAGVEVECLRVRLRIRNPSGSGAAAQPVISLRKTIRDGLSQAASLDSEVFQSRTYESYVSDRKQELIWQTITVTRKGGHNEASSYFRHAFWRS